MIRKILFFFLLTVTTSQLTLAQAPGNTCATAAPITLAPGTTVSTGLQSNAGTGDDYIVGSYNSCVNTYFGDGLDGVYSINVVNPGDYTFAFTNTGTTWKSFSVHSEILPVCAVYSANCVGGMATLGSRDGVDQVINLAIGTYFIVIDSWAALTPIAGFELLITSPIGNDECSGAAELFSDVDCSFVTYTNAGATASAGAPAPTCANYQGGDVWFTYEVNSTGDFTITTEAGVMTDSGMAVYSGTCGSLAQLACDDDFGTGAMSSIAITGRTPGEIVYIRLWEYGNNNNGTFSICVTTPIPPGDNGVYLDCANERSQSLTSDFVCPPGINSAAVVFGNLDGGLLANKQVGSVNSTVCNFTGLLRRFEEINFTVPTTGFYVIEMTAAAGFDGMAYIVVNDGLFTYGSCATGTYVIGDDDSGFGLQSELSVTLTAGVNYTLVTTEYGLGSGNSPYTWTVTTGPNINWETIFPIEWYTTAAGGSPIQTGPGFDPVNFPGSGLTDTTVPGIYPYWYACPTAPASRTRVDFVIGKHWEGATSSDWNTASNWYGNSVPTDTQCLYIQSGTPNDPVIGDDNNGDGLNLTIDTGATLTLNSDGNANNFGSSLTIQDNIDIQGTGVLTVEDDASLIQVNDTPSVANSGNIILNRNADIRRSDYVYWSSPVQNYNVSNVYGAFTPLSYIYQWTPTVPTGTFTPGVLPTGGMPICYGNWALNSSATMNLGKGYIVRGPTNHTNTITTATSVFTGVPNNGVITHPISSGTNSFAYSNYAYNPYGTDVLTVTPFDDNWNLLGNPYPSALDAQSFLSHPSNNIIEGAVHVWTHGSQIGTYPDSFYDDFTLSYNILDYITYNFSGTNTYPDETTFLGKIGSGQAFFVLALNDSEAGSVTFNNSMRDRTHSNTQFFRTAEEDENIPDTNAIERNRIWLNLVDQNGSTSSILVGYIEGATQEKDRLFDAYTREVNSISIYSKIGDERMIIQGRALPFDENDQVPLGTVIPDAGEYTIAISNVDGLFLDGNQAIYLEDTFTGVIHNLRAAPYTFTETEAIDYEDRFLLRYTDDALSTTDLELSTLSIIAPKGSYIKINSESNPIEAVTVYDLLGRALINEINIDDLEFVINNHNLSSGAYIVKVTLNNGLSKTQKVVLKN